MGVDLLSPVHLIVLGLVAVLLFGAKRVPELGRSLGNGMREFKESLSGMDGVTEALNGMNEIRSAVSPTNIARATIPGVAEVHDSIGEVMKIAPGGVTAAATESDAVAVPAATPPPSGQ